MKQADQARRPASDESAMAHLPSASGLRPPLRRLGPLDVGALSVITTEGSISERPGSPTVTDEVEERSPTLGGRIRTFPSLMLKDILGGRITMDARGVRGREGFTWLAGTDFCIHGYAVLLPAFQMDEDEFEQQEASHGLQFQDGQPRFSVCYGQRIRNVKRLATAHPYTAAPAHVHTGKRARRAPWPPTPDGTTASALLGLTKAHTARIHRERRQ